MKKLDFKKCMLVLICVTGGFLSIIFEFKKEYRWVPMVIMGIVAIVFMLKNKMKVYFKTMILTGIFLILFYLIIEITQL